MGKRVSFELIPDAGAIETFLDERGWLEPGEHVERAEPAGEGNMNRTVRALTSNRSFVLKQSCPFVVKYPEIAAPVERLVTETRFYEVAHLDGDLSAKMPRVVAFDRDESVALLEDLGASADLSSLYGDDSLKPGELETLCEFARRLHALPVASDSALLAGLRNQAMRDLNHAHIFEVPLTEGNGLDLDSITPGLAAAAASLQKDDTYVARIIALGLVYLQAEGPSLLHGDYYPGSFLRTDDGLRIIDPEFAFPGPPEFDMGVLAAHLVLAGEDPSILDRVQQLYDAPLDPRLFRDFAAAELMRRLIGVAQLPIDATLAQKRAWLDLSQTWLLSA